MKKLLGLVTGLCLVSLGSTEAQGVPFSGSISNQIGPLAPISFPGDGDGVSTPLATLGVGASLTGAAVVPLSTTTPGGGLTFPAFPLVQLTLSGGITAATFGPGGGPAGGFGGDAPQHGVAKLGLFGPPPFAFLTVPLSAVGIEGATAMVSSPLGFVITLRGGGWTTGRAEVVGTNGPFAGALLAAATGRDTRTVNGAGTIVLVSPSLVKTNVAGSENLPVLSLLTLTYESTTTSTTTTTTTSTSTSTTLAPTTTTSTSTSTTLAPTTTTSTSTSTTLAPTTTTSTSTSTTLAPTTTTSTSTSTTLAPTTTTSTSTSTTLAPTTTTSTSTSTTLAPTTTTSTSTSTTLAPTTTTSTSTSTTLAPTTTTSTSTSTTLAPTTTTSTSTSTTLAPTTTTSTSTSTTLAPTTTSTTTLPSDSNCVVPEYWPELLKLQFLEARGCLSTSTTSTSTSTSTSTTLAPPTTSTTTLPSDSNCVVPEYWPELLKLQMLERRGCL